MTRIWVAVVAVACTGGFESRKSIYWDAQATPHITGVTMDRVAVPANGSHEIDRSFSSYDEALARDTPIAVVIANDDGSMVNGSLTLGFCKSLVVPPPGRITLEVEDDTVGPSFFDPSIGLWFSRGECHDDRGNVAVGTP